MVVTDANSQNPIEVNLSHYLTKRQQKKIKSKPDMILQFAHYLAKLEAQNGRQDVKVFASARCGLNTRPRVDLIDPNVDLTKIPYPYYRKADWILPLNVPIK